MIILNYIYLTKGAILNTLNHVYCVTPYGPHYTFNKILPKSGGGGGVKGFQEICGILGTCVK